MKLTVIHTSVVVLAEAHNPTILHPAFLSTQGIVPADWKLDGLPVCTPAISVVKYANQVVFMAEISKFQVVDNAPSPSSPIPTLAAKYVEKLPHVQYTAVGINISGFAECTAPKRWLLERFIKPGPWENEQNRPSALGLKFVYPTEPGILTLSTDSGVVRQPTDNSDRPCVLINGNYHVAISKENALGQTTAAIALFTRRLTHFDQFTRTLFSLEA